MTAGEGQTGPDGRRRSHPWIWWVWAVVVAVFVAVLVRAAFTIPEVVPSHWGASGRPDEWSSRESFLAIMAGVGALVILGLPLLGRGVGRLPTAAWNVPNRDYWFAPERIAETRRRLTEELALVAALTGALLIGVLLLTTRAQTGAADDVDGWPLLAVYALLMIGWVVRFYRVFRRPAA